MYEISLPHGTMTRFPAVGVKKNALILCPGGGYEHCSIREGAPAGRAFARRGIETFVLRYDCAPAPLGTRPLTALSAAVQWCARTRSSTAFRRSASRSADFPPGRILRAFMRRCGTARHGIRRERISRSISRMPPCCVIRSCPPASTPIAAALNSLQETIWKNSRRSRSKIWCLPDMPRTFLWHTLTDETVPVENSLLLEKSLRRAGVSHEMHLFPHGVHGLALADMETSDIEKGRLPDRHIARWQALCAEWLKE